MQVGWGWQGFSAFLDMLEIQVDRGDGKGWVFLTYDTTPNYTDTFPLPATPTKWKYRAIYRAIYRVGDARRRRAGGHLEQHAGDHGGRVEARRHKY